MNKHYYILQLQSTISMMFPISGLYTTIAADIMARYKRICGYDVFSHRYR